MRRIAFIGIENADSDVLHGALRRNLGADAEINAFERDVAAVKVAPFLVAKNADGQLEGSNSVAYISSSVDPDLAKKISRLSKAGVTVRKDFSDFKPEAQDDEIAAWLTTGDWPEPEPEEEDDESDLLALLEDDDEDEEDSFESPAAPVTAEPTRYEQEEPTTVSSPADTDAEEDDDLPVWGNSAPSQPVVEEYPTRRFDSMSANDGIAEPTRRSSRAAEPAQVEEDDDLSLPSYGDSFNDAPVAKAESSYLDDNDDLPLFDAPSDREEAPAQRQDISDFGDDDDLPAFNTAPVREEEPVKAASSDFGFDDDDLPAFSSAPAREEESVPNVNDSFFDGDDDLPDFGSFPVQEEKPAPRASVSDFDSDEGDDDLPDFSAAPVAREEEPKTAQDSFDDGDDDLPVWGTDVDEFATSQTPQVAERREPVIPVDDDFGFGDADSSDDDDLPDFSASAQPEAPVSRRDVRARPEIPVIDDFSDDEIDLPTFSPESFASADNDGDSEEDDLPSFSAAPEPAEAPSRRSRKDFLRAAEEIARKANEEEAAPVAVSDSEDDEDGDSLPDFSPQFSPVVPITDDDDELPAPVRRAAVVQDDDRGDDLPEFVNRAEKKEEPEEDEDDADFFEFAPKVKKPAYAAPAEQQPEWGVPVQRQEVVAPVRRERVRPEPVAHEEAPVLEKPRARREPEAHVEAPVRREAPVERKPRPVVEEEPELRAAPARVERQRPVAPPVEDDFDPTAVPPYMEELQPEQRRAQSTMELLRREYDSETVMKVRGSGSAVCFYVTGSHGGAGKTTSTWMMANTMAAALKKDPTRPVFLIEGDYENSKLAQRLNLPPEKNSGKLAEFFRRLSSDMSLVSKQKINMAGVTEKIIKESIYVNEHGVNIIAAPYDLTKRDGRFLRIAIQKSVEYAERQGGFVFIDADTLSNDDILDRTLAAKATHVILVSFGDKDHVDDTHRAIHTLTTPNVKSVSNHQSTNGMGVPKDRIKLFFNKTGTERFEDLQRTMRPYLTEGHLPTVQGLNDGGWIGNLTGSDFLNAVTSYAAFMNRVSPMPELRSYESRVPQKTTQRSSFMKMFGRNR